jgi:hypothetical protein
MFTPSLVPCAVISNNYVQALLSVVIARRIWRRSAWHAASRSVHEASFGALTPLKQAKPSFPEFHAAQQLFRSPTSDLRAHLATLLTNLVRMCTAI